MNSITTLPTYREMRGISSTMGKPLTRRNSMLSIAGLSAYSTSISTTDTNNNSISINPSGNKATLMQLQMPMPLTVPQSQSMSTLSSSSSLSSSMYQRHYHHQQQKPPPLAEFTCACAPGWTGPACEISKYNYSHYFFQSKLLSTHRLFSTWFDLQTFLI